MAGASTPAPDPNTPMGGTKQIPSSVLIPHNKMSEAVVRGESDTLGSLGRAGVSGFDPPLTW